MDRRFQHALMAAFDDTRPHFAATFQHPQHDCLPAAALVWHGLAFGLVHVLDLASDESFVDLDWAGTANLAAGFDHRHPQPMQHEPRRLLRDLDVLRQFIGADAVLTIRQHPTGHEPFVQWDRGVLEYGAHLRRELPLDVRALALPLALLRQPRDIIASTGRADYDPVRPAFGYHVGHAVVGVREEENRVL